MYLIKFSEKSSAITMPVSQAFIWENIKLYFVSVYGFSGPVYERTSTNGLKDVITVWHIIYDGLGRANFIFHGQLP